MTFLRIMTRESFESKQLLAVAERYALAQRVVPITTFRHCDGDDTLVMKQRPWRLGADGRLLLYCHGLEGDEQPRIPGCYRPQDCVGVVPSSPSLSDIIFSWQVARHLNTLGPYPLWCETPGTYTDFTVPEKLHPIEFDIDGRGGYLFAPHEVPPLLEEVWGW
jgi:hypothetical protein